MKEKYTPKDYHREMFRRAYMIPYVGLYAEMGLGKTAVTLFVIRRLLREGKARKVLVVAPPAVARHTWPAEINKWDGLEELDYRVLDPKLKRLKKTDPSRLRLKLKPEEGVIGGPERIHILPRDPAPYWLAWHIQQKYAHWEYDLVVLDEAHHYKSRQSLRWALMMRVREDRKISRMIHLTGTPADEGYHELWPQIALLDRGKRLGESITRFRTRYLVENPYARGKFFLRPGAKEEIESKISDISFFFRARDFLDIPDKSVYDIPVYLEKEEQKKYQEFATEMVAEFDGETISPVDRRVLAGKLLQLCNGSIYRWDSKLEQNVIHEFHERKLDKLAELVEQADGPVLVAYIFRFDLQKIRERWPKALDFQDPRNVDRWNAGEAKVGVIHPAAAEGLNLQKGGRILVWYGLPWSSRQYKQTEARLHRTGQEKRVLVYRLLVEGGYDKVVARALAQKHAGAEALAESLSSYIKELRK